ncbi:hypothetical protein [Propionicicella superfundia]|uniref:hypothetical protein n=1 Tax=Propionicicella superfundia TaxID=348582 RepID=UPI0003FFCC9D|nr:hypothetical protein [Propionicicella superfundia]
MKRKELQDAVEEKAQQAAELGAQACTAAKAKIGPYVEQAGERLGPYVEQAGERIGPYVEQASEKIAPYVDKVAPIAQDAVAKSAAATVQALEALQPHIEDALAKIAPAVEDARGKVTTEFMPKVTEVLHEVADRSLVKDAADDVAEAVASVTGSEVDVAQKKGGVGKKILLVGAIAASLAGAVALIKKLTESKSGWQPHSASSYTPPTFSATQADSDMTAEGAPPVDESPAEQADPAEAQAAEADVEQVAETGADPEAAAEPDEVEAPDDEAEAAEAETDDAEDAPRPVTEDDEAGGEEPFRS